MKHSNQNWGDAMVDGFATLKLSIPDVMGNQQYSAEKEVVIGRDAKCTIILANSNVSRKHARIFRDDKGYLLEDLGSHNGTLLNGRLARKERIQDGDTINIADVEILFMFKESKADEPQKMNLSNEDLGPAARDSTSFIDLTELKKAQMEELRKNKPDTANPWEQV